MQVRFTLPLFMRMRTSMCHTCVTCSAGCDRGRIMTPRFRQVAKHFVSDPEVRFGKFNCEAQYNERFCEVHEIAYMPTYVLFDEYRTTGHRFNPPTVPSVHEMRMWVAETLTV